MALFNITVMVSNTLIKNCMSTPYFFGTLLGRMLVMNVRLNKRPHSLQRPWVNCRRPGR